MGKWEPIFWIWGSGVAIFALLMLYESLKSKKKKR
jgi:hypothetical protein